MSIMEEQEKKMKCHCPTQKITEGCKSILSFVIFIILFPIHFFKNLFVLPKNFETKNKNTIKLFLYSSWFKSLSKIHSIKFWSFFITGIVIFGGCGVWLEVAKVLMVYFQDSTKEIPLEELNKALLFYVTTLLGGIGSQVFLDDDIPKQIKSGSWLLIILVYFCTAGIAYTQSAINSKNVLIICLILTLVSLSIAWLINAYNKSLDEVSINDMLGGDEFGFNSTTLLPTEEISPPHQNDPLKADFSNLKEY